MPAISMFYGIIMVQAWIEIHREDLLADWELAVNGQDWSFALSKLNGIRYARVAKGQFFSGIMVW